MLTFDPSSRSLSYQDAYCRIEGWQLSLEVDRQRLSSAMAQVVVHQDLDFTLEFPAVGIEWHITIATSPDDNTLLVCSTIRNNAERPARLGKAALLSTNRPVHVGASSADLVCLSLLKELYPRRVYSLADPECPRTSKVKTQFYNRADRSALQVGFATYLRADTEVRHTFDPARGLTGLEAWCDFAAWELGPGQSTETETLLLASGDDPYAQLERWADNVSAHCQPRRWEDAPIGWLGWAWVDPMTVERYEDVVIRNSQAIQRRLGGFGLHYVWVSIANLADGVPGRC